jgi:hypothetical protein
MIKRTPPWRVLSSLHLLFLFLPKRRRMQQMRAGSADDDTFVSFAR